MVKSRLKESMKYFGGLIDPEKDEELRKTKLGISSPSSSNLPHQSYLRRWNSTVESWGTPSKAPLLPPLSPYHERRVPWYPRSPPPPFFKTTILPQRDVDDKVAKITKLLQNKNEDKKGGGDSNNKSNSEVVELINDFHKQYQTLYTLYDNIKGEVTSSVNTHDSNEATSSTTSSDSESYYSSSELSAKSSPRLDNVRDIFKQKNDPSTPMTTPIEIIELRNRLNSMSEEKEAMSSENASTLKRLEDSEKIISDLRVEVERYENIKKSLVNDCNQLKARLVEKESIGVAQMSEMESQLYNLRMEQKRWVLEKKELEEKIAGSGKLGEENFGLLARILELQETSQGKDRTIEPDEQIVFKGNDASAQVQGIMDQVDVLQEELHSLIRQKSESESNLERANQELSQARDHIASLQIKASDFHKLVQKNEGLEKKLKDLGEKIRNSRIEAKNLQKEKQELVKRISRVEKLLQERDGDFSYVKTKYEDLERDSSIQITELKGEVQKLQVEKSQIESKVEKKKQNLSDSLSEMQQQNAELMKKLTEHQLITESQEETIKKLKENLESLENEKREDQKEKEKLSKEIAKMEERNSKLNTKIGENQATLNNQIEEFQTSIKTQEELIDKLTKELNQIKGDYSVSKANLTLAEKKIEETADEFYKKFEDSLRILSRRIRVAEQLHLENKDVCNKTKAKYEDENNYLKEMIEATGVSVCKMKEITVSANNMLTGLDGLSLKFEECSDNFMNRISKVSCEVFFVKDWVKRRNNTVKHMHEDIMCLATQVDTKEIEILGLREKVWKLENKVRELEKTMIDKEESLLGMEEEKREAIRQLCVWIDYHRSRSDYLKRILSEVYAVRSQRAT